jgi:kynurenine 3-monooxygenase
MLVRGFVGLVGVPVLAGGILLLLRYKRTVDVGLRAAFGSVDSMVELMTMKV